jgi:hypothetical protein
MWNNHRSETLPKLKDVIAGARSNLSDTECQEMEELLTEFDAIFATNSKDYRQTDRVYHRIDMGET